MSSVVESVGKDQPIIEKENGYRTSEVPYDFVSMGPNALLAMAAITYEGAKTHGVNNWLGGDVNDHLNKALTHIYAHLAGDTSDDHIGHGAWRMHAALEIYLRNAKTNESPDGHRSA